MADIKESVVELIGNTPILKLNNCPSQNIPHSTASV